jgi:glyoxylase-like metal-dependent hydrolase (beta-lactamase superfamily II)
MAESAHFSDTCFKSENFCQNLINVLKISNIQIQPRKKTGVMKMNELIVLSIEQIRNDNISVTYHPVILINDKEIVLVDCGTPGSLLKIKEEAQAQNVNMDNLTKVVITHHDMDHIGSLAELKHAYPDVQILADANRLYQNQSDFYNWVTSHYNISFICTRTD